MHRPLGPGTERAPGARRSSSADPPNYEPEAADSIAALAARGGRPVDEMLYDLMLGDGGHALLYWPILNYFDGNLDPAADMLAHAHTVPGLE